MCFTKSYSCGWPCTGKIVSEADSKHPTGKEGHGNKTLLTWSFLPFSRSFPKFHQFYLAKTNYGTVWAKPDGQSDTNIDRHKVKTERSKHLFLLLHPSLSNPFLSLHSQHLFFFISRSSSAVAPLQLNSFCDKVYLTLLRSACTRWHSFRCIKHGVLWKVCDHVVWMRRLRISRLWRLPSGGRQHLCKSR